MAPTTHHAYGKKIKVFPSLAVVAGLWMVPIYSTDSQEPFSADYEFAAVYNTRGNPRAAGLDLTLQYPLSWQARESTLPDHVQVFLGVVDYSISLCNLIVTLFSNRNSEAATKSALELDDLPNYAPNDATLVASSPTVLAGHPGGMLDYRQAFLVDDVPFMRSTRSYLFTYKNRFIELSCATVGRSDSDTLEAQYNRLATSVFSGIARTLTVQEESNVPLGATAPVNELPLKVFGVAPLANSIAPNEFLVEQRNVSASPNTEVVQVIRGTPGRFMRNTTRLAEEAEIREERAAQEVAREINQRRLASLRAAEEALEEAATASQPTILNKRPVRSARKLLVPLAGGLAIDPDTGQLYGGGQGGVYVPLKSPK